MTKRQMDKIVNDPLLTNLKVDVNSWTDEDESWDNLKLII